ncbi:MAG: hypothetical protein JWL82_370 [Parcubacteria group bacterium]|nr:hypothetical protein [Parcubacteria group bacterium]
METRRVHEVVHTLRQKPLHVRENIALGVSGGITLLVAIGWMGALVAGGTLRLDSGTLASSGAGAPDVTQVVASSKSSFSDLLGAAGAAFGGATSSPSIEIVDTEVHSSLDQNTIPANLTVIHF